MKTRRRLIVVYLLLTLVLVSTIGVSAWMIYKENNSYDFNFNLDSSDIFDASMTATININGNDILLDNSNQDYYDQESYTFKFTNKNLNNLSAINIDILIEAKKNLEVRFKLVEMWLENDEVAANPNIVSWTIGEDVSLENGNDTFTNCESNVFVYGDKSIAKNTEKSFNVISGANIGLNTNNYTLFFTIQVEVIQADYSSIWNLNNVVQDENGEFKNKLNIKNGKINKVEIIWDNIGISGLSRGTFIELRSIDKVYGYVFNPEINNRIQIDNGDYEIYVFIHKLFKYNVILEDETLKIVVSFNDMPGYQGIQGVIFSPNTIREYAASRFYSSGDIVYTIDENGLKSYWRVKDGVTNSQNEHPETATWSWEPLGMRWSSDKVFSIDQIVYYDNTFWQSKTNYNNSMPGENHWSWERLDNVWQSGNEYHQGDIVVFEGSYYYVPSNINNSYNPPTSSNGFNSPYEIVGITFAEEVRGSYKTGDIVYHNGYFYKSINSWGNIPEFYENDGWLILNKSIFDYNRNYITGDIVFYNGNYYIASRDVKGQMPTKTNFWQPTNTIVNDKWDPTKAYNAEDYIIYNDKHYILKSGYQNIVNQVPGKSFYWTELTDKWSKFNIYKPNDRNSIVFYNNSWWFWNYNLNSDQLTSDNSSPVPGEIGANNEKYWQEITMDWRPHNKYNQGDLVIYIGSFWEALVDPDNIIPGHDFTVWKRYKIDWNPNN